jgi:hypothetical protein
MLPRATDHLLEIRRVDARIARLNSSSRVEDLEEGQTYELFNVEIVFRFGAAGHETPPLPAQALIHDVVLGALLGIAESIVGRLDFAESSVVAGLLVVRMETLGKKAIDTMNCFGLRCRTYLEHVVIVNKAFVTHGGVS